jgi:hypothetical protein
MSTCNRLDLESPLGSWPTIYIYAQKFPGHWSQLSRIARWKLVVAAYTEALFYCRLRQPTKSGPPLYFDLLGNCTHRDCFLTNRFCEWSFHHRWRECQSHRGQKVCGCYLARFFMFSNFYAFLYYTTLHNTTLWCISKVTMKHMQKPDWKSDLPIFSYGGRKWMCVGFLTGW